MVTNTPVGMLRAIVILPSCLGFTVVHRRYARLAPAATTGAISFVTADCAWMTSKQEVIAMIDCSAVSTRVSRKLARRFRSVQAIFSARKKAHKTLDLECLSMTYGVVRAFQVIVNTF